MPDNCELRVLTTHTFNFSIKYFQQFSLFFSQFFLLLKYTLPISIFLKKYHYYFIKYSLVKALVKESTHAQVNCHLMTT